MAILFKLEEIPGWIGVGGSPPTLKVRPSKKPPQRLAAGISNFISFSFLLYNAVPVFLLREFRPYV